MSMKVKVIIVAVFVVVLGVGGLVASKAEEKKVGEACETYKSSQCPGPGGNCLVTKAGQYCTIECKDDSACPGGWKCQSVTSETYSGKTGQKTAEKEIRMCIRP
jgi:hypothetical protein